ncbi:MAG: GGDEF domain-containing protein [Eubacterium sp.]|nr:GGDEF domain-containing protein [Eubacterium sp.]
MAERDSIGKKIKIGVFISDWNYEVVYQFLTGIKEYLAEHDDVRIDVFNDFGTGRRSASQRSGQEIFGLPDIEIYDGIIIEGDQAWPVSFRRTVVERALKLGKPAVSVNYRVEGCVTTGTDNYQAMFDMTEHVIGTHHARRLAFVRGNTESWEENDRLQGFYDACKRHGIDAEGIPLYGGTWFRETGREAGKEILRGWKREQMPQAVVCANDDLASGVIEVFMQAGLRIPDDVIVTGFDHLSQSALEEPAITTVDRNYQGTILTALQLVTDRIRGKEPDYCSADGAGNNKPDNITPDTKPDDHLPDNTQGNHTEDVFYCPHKLITSASCGCSMESVPVDKLKKKYLNEIIELRFMFGTFHDIIQEIRGCRNISEAVSYLEDFLVQMGVGDGCFVLNRSYFSSSFSDNFKDIGLNNSSEDQRGIVIAAIQAGSPVSTEMGSGFFEIPAGSTLPDKILKDANLWIYYPMNCSDRNIGYVGLAGVAEAAEFNLIESMVMQISSELDTICQRMVVESLNNRLKNLYVQDELTGLYNRFGMEKYGLEFYDRQISGGGKVELFFIDIDCMKHINDSYGHQEGDRAIQAVGNAVREICQAEDKVGIRYGGDEFLILCSPEEGLSDRIREKIAEEAGRLEVRAGLTVSIGCAEAKSGESFEGIIKAADSHMYEEKKEKHVIAERK